ncbi:MAG: HspR [Dehalococcoidia bacterium]|nr:HspR [Dehalococcoidia bacterium]
MQEIQGLYIISVAARILEMHPQTLRKYERAGFIVPSRTIGMLRLYSAEDIARLRLIKHLVENLNLNLAGVELVLQMLPSLVSLRELSESSFSEQELKRQVRVKTDDMLAHLGVSAR